MAASVRYEGCRGIKALAKILKERGFPKNIEVTFSKTYPSFLTVKEGSTFLTKPLFPQEREDVAGCAIASARVLVSSAEPVP